MELPGHGDKTKQLYNSWAQDFGPAPGEDAIHALPQLAEDSEDDEDDSDRTPTT